MLIERSKHEFFDDVANYLISLISLTLSLELYRSGTASAYQARHTIYLDSKQAGKRLTFYPSTLLMDFFGGTRPSNLVLEEELVEIPPHAKLKLGVLEKPLYALEVSMFVNYFERRRPTVETIFGRSTHNWPMHWNFGRIVRNSVVHCGRVNFSSSTAAPVSWRGLNYSPCDNGRLVMNGDLWSADLIYLMMDMDALLSTG